MRKILSVLTTMAIIFVLLIASSQAQTTYKWRMQTSGYAGGIEQELCPKYVDWVKRESGGRLNIEWFFAPEIAPEKEITTVCGKGVFEMGSTYGGYIYGLYPEMELAAGIPGMNRPPVSDMWKLNNESKLTDLMRETMKKDNVYYLGWYNIGPYPVLATRVPIRTLADFKGVKIRVFGMNAKVYEKFGVSPVYFPGSEAYMALKLGTVDGITYTAEAIEGFKWYEVMKYLIRPELIGGVGNMFVVNQQKWDALPPDLKDVLKRSVAYIHKESTDFYDQIFKRIGELSKQGYFEIITLPPADQQKILQTIQDTTWKEFGAQNAGCAKGMDIIREWYSKR